MKDVFLGLGTNLGDRVQNLRDAIGALKPHATIQALSSIYESVPHEVEGDQPLYLNMVARVSTELAPIELLQELKAIEKNMGRAPDTHLESRPIDIDILLYGDQVIEIPGLAIPHRDMHKRHFVLVPLEEIASFHFHPAMQKPIIDLLDDLGAYDELVWLSEEQL